MNYRLADPKFTGFQPATAQEAIIKFRRLQATGISSFRYPELFCDCAMKLNDAESQKFEDWLICPQGEPGSDCLPVTVFSERNLNIHNKLIKQREETTTIDDEKSAS